MCATVQLSAPDGLYLVNTSVFLCYKTGKGALLLPSCTQVTLRVLALLGQVTWTRTSLQGKSVGVWVYLGWYNLGLREIFVSFKVM